MNAHKAGELLPLYSVDLAWHSHHEDNKGWPHMPTLLDGTVSQTSSAWPPPLSSMAWWCHISLPVQMEGDKGQPYLVPFFFCNFSNSVQLILNFAKGFWYNAVIHNSVCGPSPMCLHTTIIKSQATQSKVFSALIDSIFAWINSKALVTLSLASLPGMKPTCSNPISSWRSGPNRKAWILQII